jgi:hypothetical protein
MTSILTLKHEGTGRLVPVEVVTVIGRNDTYYRYTDKDDRADRLRGEVAEGLAALNYIKISSDEKVSRSHGMIDPDGPQVSDLNSTNGTFLNGQKVPTRHGEVGPRVQLRHGDALQVGHQRFAVELWDVSKAEREAKVRRARRGFTASDRQRLERAQRIAACLAERKGFQMRPAVGWPATIANCYHLQSSADAEGVAVCSFSAEVRGADLLFDGEAMPFSKLLPLIAKVPGRKVVVLDGDGDPSTCEVAFAGLAYEDMMLLTCSGGPASMVDDLAVSLAIGTGAVDAMKRSVSGESPALRGAFDDVVDGLEAMIGPDSNVLSIDWTKSYRGRLRVTFGDKGREDDEVLSHSLRFGSTTFRF